MRYLQLGFLLILVADAQTVTTDLDRSVSPCVNFYQFACGTWMAKNPIPADQSTWSRFDELAERNRQVLREILDKAAVEDPKRSEVQKKIGDHYASCMDEKAIETKGLAPIRPELERIAKMSSRDDLVEEIARLHSIGAGALFNFGATPDMKNS